MAITRGQFAIALCIYDSFLTSLEILPTLLAATKTSTPTNPILDGFDFLPVLQGKIKSPRTEMFWQRRLEKAARVRNWKWVESSRGDGLFDLQNDLSEKKDLSVKHPKILEMVQARFQHWKSEMKAAEPRGPLRDY